MVGKTDSELRVDERSTLVSNTTLPPPWTCLRRSSRSRSRRLRIRSTFHLPPLCQVPRYHFKAQSYFKVMYVREDSQGFVLCWYSDQTLPLHQSIDKDHMSRHINDIFKALNNNPNYAFLPNKSFLQWKCFSSLPGNKAEQGKLKKLDGIFDKIEKSLFQADAIRKTSVPRKVSKLLI